MVKNAYAQDGRKHTFVDWTLIEPGYGLSWMTGMGGWEVPHGVRISAHRPRVDLQPIIVPEKPWEASLGNYTILFEDQGLYRFYYKCGARGAKGDGPSASMLAYAESKDGVNWEKPNIGTVTFEGSTDNNLVFGLDAAQGRAVMHPCVFIDPSAPPDELYKLTYNDVVDGKDHIYGAVSPDGLHWKDLPQPLLSGYHSDTQNVIRFDPDRGRYVGYFRGWTLYERTASEDGRMYRDPETGRAESWPVLHGRRTIAYAETDRFESWPVPRTIVTTDPDDPPDLDIYTNAYAPWPDSGSHLMFPTFYRRNQDITEVHMMTSRDGLNWSRHDRRPIIPAGGPGGHWGASVYAGTGIASLRPGESSITITPNSTTHNQRHHSPQETGAPDEKYVCLATWRQDGFTSLEAESEGSCTTVPMTFTGSRLEINAWTRYGGEIRIELVDASHETMGRKAGVPAEVVPGRSFEDCDPITGNNLRRTVSWRGEADLSQLIGKPVRLRLRMRRAHLYAIQFV